MAQPEAYIGGANKLFDANGKLVNDGTRKFLQGFMQAYEAWITANSRRAERRIARDRSVDKPAADRDHRSSETPVAPGVVSNGVADLERNTLSPSPGAVLSHR